MSRVDRLVAELLPDGVVSRAIGEVASKGSNIKWANVGDTIFQYIDLTSVDRQTRKIGDTAAISQENAPSRAQQIVRTGDVIFATTRPTQMRWAKIPSEFDGQIASTGYCVIRPDEETVLGGFLAHLLGTESFRRYVEANQVAGNYPSIPDSRIRAYQIPVPPLEVQREIVSILDNFTELEAELEAALEAELQSRRHQYAYFRDDLMTFSGAGEVKWIPMGDVGVFFGGLTGKTKSDFSGGNAFFVSYVNVFNNISIDLQRGDRVRVGTDERQRELRRGDIIFTGSSETPLEVGMSSVMTADPPQPTFLNSFCIGFRLNEPDLLEPDFAKHLFRSRVMRDQIVQTASGVTRFNVSKGRLAKVAFPVPPRDQQLQIAATLDMFDALVNELSIGLPAELVARRKQYEYYRDKLLSFEEAPA